MVSSLGAFSYATPEFERTDHIESEEDKKIEDLSNQVFHALWNGCPPPDDLPPQCPTDLPPILDMNADEALARLLQLEWENASSSFKLSAIDEMRQMCEDVGYRWQEAFQCYIKPNSNNALTDNDLKAILLSELNTFLNPLGYDFDHVQDCFISHEGERAHTDDAWDIYSADCKLRIKDLLQRCFDD